MDGSSHRHDDDARGREAETPLEIPRIGWMDIARRLIAHFSANRVMLVAAGVTFYGLLALFPALTALVSIYGLAADPETVIEHVDALSLVLPPGAVDIIGDQMQRIAGQSGEALGLGFAIGLAIALWSTNTGVKAMMDAINVAYGEPEKRGFLHLNAVSFAFTLGGIAIVILTLTMIVFIPVALALIGFEAVVTTIFHFVRWPVLFLFVVAAISVLYRYGPSRRRARWRWVTPGAGIATLVWLIVSVMFSWYVANFDSYNETYGSLGAVIAFMVWMWLSATTVISGALIDAEVEHQTAQDTTVGAARPMGKRGARVADTVGPSTDD